ncbi:potassium transporter TrkA, partial [Corallococcus sp. CA053C]
MKSLGARLMVDLRYLRALSRRFRSTLVLAAAIFGLGPLLYQWRYVGPGGYRLSYGEALHHVYFLLFGQPSLPYVSDWLVETLNILIPPVSIALVVDGVVRFAYLFFARHKNDKEWVTVVSETMKGHVVVC